jgi:hypothetical protein
MDQVIALIAAELLVLAVRLLLARLANWLASSAAAA